MAEDTPDKPELDFGEDSAKTSQAAPPQSQEAAPDLDFTKARELTQPSEQEEKPELDFSKAQEHPTPTSSLVPVPAPKSKLTDKFPTATAVKDGIAYDKNGEKLGSVFSTLKTPGAHHVKNGKAYTEDGDVIGPDLGTDVPRRFPDAAVVENGFAYDKDGNVLGPVQRGFYHQDSNGKWYMGSAEEQKRLTAAGSEKGAAEVKAQDEKKNADKASDEKMRRNSGVGLTQAYRELNSPKAEKAIGVVQEAGAQGAETAVFGQQRNAEKDQRLEQQVGRGVVRAFGSTIAGMIADPKQWPLLALAPEADAVPFLKGIVSGAFAVQMTDSARRDANDLIDNWDDYSAQDRAEKITSVGLDAAFAALSAKHGGGELAGRAADKMTEHVIDPIREHVGNAMDRAGDVVSRAMLEAPTVHKGIERAVRDAVPKRERKAVSDRIKLAEDDLTAIINADDPSTPLTPGRGVELINKHLEANVDKPLQEAAGATKDSAKPVVANFTQRLTERLEKFFSDEPGHGGAARDAAIKYVLDRMKMEHDTGNGSKAVREPNLYEAEDLRRKMSAEGEDFKQGEDRSDSDKNARKAAAKEAAVFLREVIDEGYGNEGVTGVKEARRKESALIDVRNALERLQGYIDTNPEAKLSRLAKILFDKGKLYGMTAGTILGLFHMDAAAATTIGTTAVGAAAEHVIRNVYDPFVNLARAKELAAKNQAAKASEVTTGGPKLEGPQNAPPQPPVVSPAPPAKPLPEMPPAPKPPEPAQPPPVNHKLHATLTAMFRGDVPSISDPNFEQHYQQALDQFNTYYGKVKNFAEYGGNDDYKGPRYTPEQVQQADRVHLEIQKSRAADNEYVEKTNKANAEKHAKEMAKYEAKAKVVQAKIDAAAKEAEAKEKAAADQKSQEDVATLLADERVAHSPVMQATDMATNLGTVGEHTSEKIYGHENGHIMSYTAEGLTPIQMISASHEEAQSRNAVAAVQVDHSEKEEGAIGVRQRVVGLLGGAAYDEVHQGIPLNRNSGASGDVRKARELLRKSGATPDEVNKLMEAMYERAKQHVSNPEALSIVQANMPLRESNLHEDYLMSPGRMDSYVQKLQGVYGNGEAKIGKPAGNAQRGSAGRDGAGANSRGEAGDSDGSSERVPAKEVREADEGSKRGASDERAGGSKKGSGATNVDEGTNDVATLEIPKERTTGDEAIDAAIKSGGAIPGGVQKGFEYTKPDGTEVKTPAMAYFHDPKTGTSLNLPMADITPEAVKQHITESRKKYNIEE